MGAFWLIVLGVIAMILFSCIKVMREYERAVVFRLGRIIGAKGPGLIILLPLIDRAVKVPLRTVTMEVEPQDIITRDNVSVKVDAVVYFQVLNPVQAIIKVENYLYATRQLASVTMRSVLGQFELDDLLSGRDKLNAQLQLLLDEQTEPWGVKVSNVDLRNVDLTTEMQRAMAKQAEAERERRAKIIGAEGEFQSAQRLSEAAAIMAREPMTLQLRYLQTLREIASENNSTTIFPVPVDLLNSFKNMMDRSHMTPAAPATPPALPPPPTPPASN